MKKLWSIPIVLAYLYALTILTQSGFDSYFNIPLGFISSSIVNNTLSAYILLKVVLGFVALIGWWWPLVALMIIGVGFLSYIYFDDHKTIFIWVITTAAFLLLYNATDLGELLAQKKTNFLVLSPECPTLGLDKKYIVADIYEGKAILVPIDPVTKKLEQGFMLKEISELPCQLQYEDVGPISK